MTIADDIIQGQLPNIQQHLAGGETLDDIDEYGFTPLIEAAIVGNVPAAKLLLENGVAVDKPDVTGRTALHWASDNNNVELVQLLLKQGSDPNAYNRGGQSVLVYPLLRNQWLLKETLYQHGASLPFALDFINAKLVGHRYELKGDVDIVLPSGRYIELDYEGFILEFTLAVVKDSLSRFRSNYAARHLRSYFTHVYEIIDGLEAASALLKYQYHRISGLELEKRLRPYIAQPLLIMPVAYQGHAIAYVRYQNFFAKIDRGENSLREGSVNIYYLSNPSLFNTQFLTALMFKKQTEHFFHQQINQLLQLKHILTLPLSSQQTGNCSWANMEAVIPTGLFLQRLLLSDSFELNLSSTEEAAHQSLAFYQQWLTWDKDRALDECLMGFEQLSTARQASKAAMLGAILFQACNYGNKVHMKRAEKILSILMKPEFHYVLRSYLEIYCAKRLTPRGNNLLKLLEDNGIDANLGIQSIATQMNDKKSQT